MVWPFRSKNSNPVITAVENRLTQMGQVLAKQNAGIESRLTERVEDIRLQSGTKTPTPGHVQTAVRSFRRQSPSPLGWQTGRGLTTLTGEYQDYKGPVHNLGEISKAIDVESLFARAVQRHRELCMKNGWRLVGRDQQRVRYLTRRLNEIMLVSDTTFGQILREVFSNVVTFSNHFLIMKRDPARSSGGKTRLHGRTHDPIAGHYCADPTTMSAKQSKSGLTERWRQSMSQSGFGSTGQKAKFFRPSDVIHIFLDRRTGFIFGTPYVIPVLDDMRLLRRLEELVDIISHQHAFPLLVVKGGTDENPADEVLMPGGAMIPEVDIATEKMENLDFEGGIVVTERYDIQFVGADGKAIDLAPYLKYLELRVLGGLRISEIDLGRGDSANRNTAQSITQNLIDACTEIQKVVEEVFTWRFFFPLLMEGGFNVDLSRPEEDMVYLDFAPIDTAEQRQQEVHALEQYQGNLLGETEARAACGRQPIGEGEVRKDLYLERVTKPTAKVEATIKAQQAASKATTTSKSRPTNQHGTKPKPKISKNQLERYQALYEDQAKYHYRVAADNFLAGLHLRPGQDLDIDAVWKQTSKPKHVKALGVDASFQSVRLIYRLRAAEAGILVDARTYLTPLIELGFSTAVGPEDPDRAYVSRDETEAFFRSRVRDPLKDALKASVDSLRVWSSGRPSTIAMRSTLEVYEMDVVSCVGRQAKLAYAYGFQIGAQAIGAEGILVTHEKGSMCPRAGNKLVSADMDLNRLVCIRSGCRMRYSVTSQ